MVPIMGVNMRLPHRFRRYRREEVCTKHDGDHNFDFDGTGVKKFVQNMMVITILIPTISKIQKCKRHIQNIMRLTGIEPMANAWKAFMLPLHHRRLA